VRNWQRTDNCKRPGSPQSGQEAPNDHSSNFVFLIMVKTYA
jgi:hypothetical protein